MDCDAYKDDLLDVLYGEADPATNRRFQEHQARCAACREEVSSLRRVRRDLDGWVLAPRAASRMKPLFRPQFLAAAAAVLMSVTAGAVVVTKGEIHYPNGQLAFRLAQPSQEVAELRQLVREQEERHQRALADLRGAAQPAAASPSGPADRDELLREVARLVRESETRQAAVFKASLGDLEDRSQSQRRVDLAQVSAWLSVLEGKTELRAVKQTELMGRMFQASSQGK